LFNSEDYAEEPLPWPWTNNTRTLPKRCGGAFRELVYQVLARLSSARVVRCWVKSRNERNPRD